MSNPLSPVPQPTAPQLPHGWQKTPTKENFKKDKTRQHSLGSMPSVAPGGAFQAGRRATQQSDNSEDTVATGATGTRSIFGRRLKKKEVGIHSPHMANRQMTSAADGGDAYDDKWETATLAIDELVPEEQEALAPLDLTGDGMIKLDDLKAAAKMYGAAQELGVINMDSFPMHIQQELKAFDTDNDNRIDSQELAHAARLYRESQRTQARLVKSTVLMAIVSIVLLGAMLGITILAVDLMKETQTGNNGVMVVKGSDKPVQIQEQHINVPLGALPLLATNDPVRFLDQMKTVIVRTPEDGYRRTTVTDASLQWTSNTVGMVIYTTHGHTVTVQADPQNVTTEGHVTLQGGRSFDVCAPCGEAGAVSMLLTLEEKDMLANYLAQSTEKINSGSSRACRLQDGTRLQVPQGGDDIDCAPLQLDGVSDTFYGRGHFTDVDGLNVAVRFAVNGGSRNMVFEYTEQNATSAFVGKRATYFDDASYYYRGGRLQRCADSTPWSADTNLRAGIVGDGVTFTVEEIHDGSFELTIPPRGTLRECEAVYRTNQAFLQANVNTTTPTGANKRRGAILVADDKKLHKEKARMQYYSHMLSEIEKAGERRAETLAAADVMANDAYDSCTIQNGNACMLKDGNCLFSFRGSDDFQDWVSNAAGIFGSTTVNGRRMHEGFVAEFAKLRAVGLDREVRGCRGTPHFVGHSLGGAIATVARQHYNKGRVTTFGAPKVFDDNSGCAVPGVNRYYHDEDPVAGNLFGLMGDYWHGQDSQELYKSCTSRHWWGGCRSHGWRWRRASCTSHSGTWSVNFGAHSMDNYENYY